MTPAEPMSVAVLAGGLATRMRPLTERIPKSLLDVDGEPFIVHQLRLLRSRGLKRAVICAGYLGEQIEEVIGDGQTFDLQVSYSFDGPRLLGTAGALRRALPLLEDAFFVLYGDSYLTCDYLAVQAAYERSGRAALMTVYRNDNSGDRSNVELVENQLIAYDKRHPTPRMHHIDYGLGVLSRRALADLPLDEPTDLADTYRDLLARGELAGYEVSERFYEIGSAAGLDDLRQFLRDGAQATDSPSASLRDDVPSATLRAS
jgi:MurNAc alpha-1-phosphate uridylyltransferase